MAKVFLGVGHGGSDPGAVGYLREADVNLTMALACRDYLAARGVTVRMSRVRDEDDPIGQVVRECNDFGPELAVDVHNNSGGGDGFECYYHYGGGLSRTLAKSIEAEVLSMGQNSRGCKIRKNDAGYDYYAFIRQTACPAVICEGVFVDNAKDAAQADTAEEQRAFGVAYAKGILKTLGIVDSGGAPQPAGRAYAHSIGEHVVFSTCYVSSTDPIGKAIPARKMIKNHGVITRIVDAANPYLLDDGMCWVNDGDIRGMYEG